jgi:hypothetical protein
LRERMRRRAGPIRVRLESLTYTFLFAVAVSWITNYQDLGHGSLEPAIMVRVGFISSRRTRSTGAFLSMLYNCSPDARFRCFRALARAARMARIYARAEFSVTGVTPLCDNDLSVIPGNHLASRAGNPRRKLRLAPPASTRFPAFAGSDRRAHSRGAKRAVTLSQPCGITT